MKTEVISGQNFTAGHIKFINSRTVNGISDDLQKTLEPQMKNLLPELENMIFEKPYDLFISRARNMRGFYAVDANTDFANVISADEAKKGSPSLVYAGRLERFISAADEAMRSFEKARDYNELTKTRGFFEIIWNKLFRK